MAQEARTIEVKPTTRAKLAQIRATVVGLQAQHNAILEAILDSNGVDQDQEKWNYEGDRGMFWTGDRPPWLKADMEVKPLAPTPPPDGAAKPDAEPVPINRAARRQKGRKVPLDESELEKVAAAPSTAAANGEKQPE